MIKAIDISSYQERPNWENIKMSGINAAILRCHQRFGIDASFNYNYNNAVKNGVRLGVYKLSYANNADEAIAEANAVLEVLDGRELDFPVFYDMEWEDQESFGKDRLYSIITSFLNVIQNAGYNVGIYCNQNWYNNFIPDSLKNDYPFWVASYPKYDKGVIQENLKPTVKNLFAWQYSKKGSVLGIGGDVDMDIIYDDVIVIDPEPEVETVGTTAEDILKIMRSWLGLSRTGHTHKVIIDTYNSYLPHPRGYAVSYDDDYCDATVSAAFVKAKAVDIIGGIECGVEEHVRKFILEGIWIEDGTITPKVGDIVCYNWDQDGQPNNGFSDHIGIVEQVNGRSFITIEGNMAGGIVGRRTVNIGDGFIRGFARPKYATKSASGEIVAPALKPLDEIAQEVLAGLWGNGLDRIARLIEAGYNSSLVQDRVNTILIGTDTQIPPSQEDAVSKDISRTPKWVGKVIANKLNVRTWAGTSYPRIKSYPSLSYGNLIDVCDTVKDVNGADWYFVKIAGQFFGFVSSEYVEKV